MEQKMELSIGEELELVNGVKKGEAGAVERLKENKLRFVKAIAKKYQNQGLTMDELIDEGNKGLIAAAEHFDEQRGYKFISYAVWWIRNSMKWAVESQKA